ncbi:MAG: sigma 54-interacting transcriptional regulator [Myxococcota bacterium]
MPELILFNGETPVLRCPLLGQHVAIGRSPANDISLPDEDAPPLLCSLEPGPGGSYRVLARGGRPVHVNNEPTQDHILRAGDRIRLGHLVGRYDPSAPVDEKAAPRAQQRTGILRTNGDGSLSRTDLRLRLPTEHGGAVVVIPEGGLSIGAHEDNDLVLRDDFLSTFHAQVFLRGERLFVRDLDSTNGTFVGGVRVIEAEIRLGVGLRLGRIELSVETVTAPEPVAGPEGKGPWRCGGLVTCDDEMARLFRLVEKVASHDATVCVFGETGTGKELVARALHDLGGRARGPFIALNCAALPANLIEAELFGHEKGAFTGADRARAGAFELADGGTLFLDEIGELPLEMQGKLLRVLEERRVRRIGGRSDLAVDVRVVAATHRDLVEHAQRGAFREDLLHRLYVIPLRLPPLRSRPRDIPFLARHLAQRLSPSADVVVLERRAEEKLLAHPFPGNVRELRNVVQRALVLGDGKVIRTEDIDFIPTSLSQHQEAAKVYRAGMTLDDIEREAIRGALASYRSAAEAARALGLPKTTFWRRATALGLLKKDGNGPAGHGPADR